MRSSEANRRLVREESFSRFVITLVPMRGVDGVRALRWLLKRARRQFRLVAVDVREEESAPADLAADQEGQAESLSRLDGR